VCSTNLETIRALRLSTPRKLTGMARRLWSTIILGAGPVGLTTALFAARRGKVVIVHPPRTDGSDPQRIDSVPVSPLALFVELGLHPADLAVDCVHDIRLVAWASRHPVLSKCAASVHVERPRLERMLLKLVQLRSEIELRSDLTIHDLPPADLILDATGRRAISARERFRVSTPRIGRTLIARGVFSKRQQALRLACLPTGYAYRLGNQTTMTLGLVEDRAARNTTPYSIFDRLWKFGAGWLLRELSIDDMAPGKGGAASVQWTDGEGPIIRVGDAAFARDALASQGIANGISHGLRVLEQRGDLGRLAQAQHSEMVSHVTRLATLMSTCRHRHCESWLNHRKALAMASSAFSCLSPRSG
jgi:hypothetical protein